MPSRLCGSLSAAVAFVLLSAPSGHAADDLSLLVVSSTDQSVVYQTGLLDRPLDRILQALDSGVPSRVEVVVELWRVRSRWFDHLEWSVSDEFVVRHDPLLQEYEVRTEVPVWRSFDSVEDLTAWLMAPGPSELRPPERMRAGTEYFLAAEVRIEPFTAEQMGAVERWLSGDEESGTDDGVGDYLLDLVVRMSGLGDLTVGGRSDRFLAGRE